MIRTLLNLTRSHINPYRITRSFLNTNCNHGREERLSTLSSGLLWPCSCYWLRCRSRWCSSVCPTSLHRLLLDTLSLHSSSSLTVSNKIEQFITHRPNSYVPGHTTGNLLGLPRDRHPDILNHVHHWGMGVIVGPIRAIMSYYGIIGPVASMLFLPIRMAADQIVENAAGTSDLPWTWPINEQVIDMVHKGVYAFVAGYITDKLVRGVDWFN